MLLKKENKSHKHTPQKVLKMDKNEQCKRQPLSELKYYPNSILIDDFFLDNLTQNSKQVILASEQQKVIKLKGNQQQNIKQIIQNLDILSKCLYKIMMQRQKIMIQKQFTLILNILYDKIQELRKQRNYYKKTIQPQTTRNNCQLNQLRNQLDYIKIQNYCLIKEKQCLTQKLGRLTKKKQFIQRQNQLLKQKLKIPHLKSTIQCSNQINYQYEEQQIQSKKQYQQKGQQKRQQRQFKKQKRYKQQYRQYKQQKRQISEFNFSQYEFNKCNSAQKISQIQKSPSFVEKCYNIQDISDSKRLSSLLKRHNLRPNQLCRIIDKSAEQIRQFNSIKSSKMIYNR